MYPIKQSFRMFHRILLLQSPRISSKVHNIVYKQALKSTIKSHLICVSAGHSAQLSTDSAHMDGAGDQKPFTTHYEGLLQAQNDKSVLIIDVREQKEINETGKLPGSIHIPMGNVVNVFSLSSEEFQRQFDKKKPNKDTKIILSCRAGARSAAVQSELQKLGYEQAYNYIGGWLEWESKQKE